MMGRWTAPIVISVSFCLAPLWAAAPAIARDRGPVCRQPSVVDEMTREVRDRNYYSEIEPGLVTETPTTDPALVRCQVCVQSAPYNMDRFGDRPIGQCLLHEFEVHILSGGFVVRDLR
jgi:hypothetical protein